MAKLSSMIGQKLFKENKEDNTISMIRIKDVNKTETLISFIDCATNEIKVTKNIEDLKGYTPLIPDAMLTFNIVKVIVGNNEEDFIYDVIVTAAKYFTIQIKDPTPFCICRQCANDVFSQLSGRTQQYAGLSISQTSCPKGVNFMEYLSCDEIIYTKVISMYRGDTISDILNILDVQPYNDILKANYHIHSTREGKPKLDFLHKHKGWCDNLELLLKDNNFQMDLDEMLDILAVDFNLSDYMVEKVLPNTDNETYDSIADDLKLWLSKTLSVMLGDVTVLKYDHDINVAEFNNCRYMFIRDNTNTTYMLIYTLDGEHHVSDLIEKDIEDANKKFSVVIYNKYNVKVK